MTITEVFQQITTALGRAGIEYMLVGSFASARYGFPRSTQDIDVVIAAAPAQLKILIHDLNEKNFYAELEAALDAHRNESLFNIIDRNTGWKIDVIFRKSTAFGEEEFKRRRKIELHGLRLFVASPEDVIIAKLEWAKQGASQRQLEDAAAVVSVQGQALDMNYLQRWISELGLTEEWKRIRVIAGST
jgi:uncharacterized nucleotidyltransferase DUF6036